MVPDQKLHNFPKAEAGACFLLPGRFTWLQKHQKRRDEVARQVLLLSRLEELRENVGQDLNHTDRAPIVHDFLVLTNDPVRKNVLSEERQHTLERFGPLTRLVEGVHKILFEILG